jgi:hypothetical protein
MPGWTHGVAESSRKGIERPGSVGDDHRFLIVFRSVADPKIRAFAELLIDCKGDRTLRGGLAGTLPRT